VREALVWISLQVLPQPGSRGHFFDQGFSFSGPGRGYRKDPAAEPKSFALMAASSIPAVTRSDQRLADWRRDPDVRHCEMAKLSSARLASTRMRSRDHFLQAHFDHRAGLSNGAGVPPS